MKNKNSSVATIVRHFIKENKQDEFEHWIKGISVKAKQFEGFEGLQLIPPPKGNREYISLFKFSSISDLKKWMDSTERQKEIEKLIAFSEKEMILRNIEGIEFWFEAPEAKITNTPPKWKMSLLTWTAVFPGVVLLSSFYHTLFNNLNPMIHTLLVTLTLVPLLTWVLMPMIIRVFKSWIFKL